MIGQQTLPVLGHAYSAFRQCEALVNAQLQRFQVVQGVFLRRTYRFIGVLVRDNVNESACCDARRRNYLRHGTPTTAVTISPANASTRGSFFVE